MFEPDTPRRAEVFAIWWHRIFGPAWLMAVPAFLIAGRVKFESYHTTDRLVEFGLVAGLSAVVGGCLMLSTFGLRGRFVLPSVLTVASAISLLCAWSLSSSPYDAVERFLLYAALFALGAAGATGTWVGWRTPLPRRG
jgi:hypothetical protein